jgi:PKD repeat protein
MKKKKWVNSKIIFTITMVFVVCCFILTSLWAVEKIDFYSASQPPIADFSASETKTDYSNVAENPYCTSSGSSQNYEYIAGVEVGDFYNTSGPSGYSDYTSMTMNLTPGGTFDVSLTPGFIGSSYTEYWKIWIDYNIDGDFEDSGEEVFSGSGSSTVTGSFTVSSSASDSTRMRVSMSYNSYPPYCGPFTYGEVEDYTARFNPEIYVLDVSQTILKDEVSGMYYSREVVTIMDTNNDPVADATVNVIFTDAVTDDGSGVTEDNGTVIFDSKKTESTGPFVNIVQDVSHETLTYNPDLNIKDMDIAYYSTVPPVAYFTASNTIINKGQGVTFTDTSINSPTSWSWTFEGGTPSTSTAQNPTITYNTEGTYDVSLTVTNSFGSDTETKTDYITVTEVLPTVGNTDVFSSTTTTANRRAMPFTMPENGEICSVTMYHTGGSGSMILGVYDGESLPANRLGVTATTAVSGSTGWQTINLTSPASVMGGTTVWLAWVYESNPGIYYETGSPGRAHSSQGWSGGMPDPFGSSTQSNYIYSIYATYSAY